MANMLALIGTILALPGLLLVALANRLDPPAEVSPPPRRGLML